MAAPLTCGRAANEASRYLGVYVVINIGEGVRETSKPYLDKLAKNVLKREEIGFNVPLSKGEVKSIIKENIIQEWQEKWNIDNKGRHLYNIKKMVDTKKSISGRNRKEEVIITRMRLGHSGLNASLFVTGGHENGFCENCGEKEKVEHVIYDCKRYDEERNELISYLNKRGKANKVLAYLLGYDFNRDRVGHRILI